MNMKRFVLGVLVGFMLAAAIGTAGTPSKLKDPSRDDALADYWSGSINASGLAQRLKSLGYDDNSVEFWVSSAKDRPETLRRWDPPQGGDRMWTHRFRDGNGFERVAFYSCKIVKSTKQQTTPTKP